MDELLSELLLMAIVCIVIFVLNKLFPSKNNNSDYYDCDDNNSILDLLDFFDSDDDDGFDFDDD